MSKLNILGVVKKIKSCSNPYLPIIEAIINSIDSIGETSRTDGNVEVILKRENCLDVDSSFIPLWRMFGGTLWRGGCGGFAIRRN